MAKVLADMPGELTVEGHTDDIPIRTSRFYSNWDLSAARSAAVANMLLATGDVTPTRLAVKGLADTKPRAPNTSAENRAKNRRVEIIIDLSGSPLQEQQIELKALIESESWIRKPSSVSSLVMHHPARLAGNHQRPLYRPIQCTLTKMHLLSAKI
ncbi:MAG: OmpA family protein [Marinobacter sp.]|nr:OmpA family protein [Marinobacter sp.]